MHTANVLTVLVNQPLSAPFVTVAVEHPSHVAVNVGVSAAKLTKQDKENAAGNKIPTLRGSATAVAWIIIMTTCVNSS